MADESYRGQFGNIGVVDEPMVFDPLSKPAAPAAHRPSAPGARKSVPIAFVVKNDGDFTAGPGEFIPIPKTALKFYTDAHGAGLFFLQAVFASTGFSVRHDRLALLVDGTVYPLAEYEAVTDSAGMGFFKLGGGYHWAMNLAPGDHSAQVLLRGGTDDGDVKSGVWVPSKVKASHKCPLVLSVLHA
jgi:hypothetical protein